MTDIDNLIGARTTIGGCGEGLAGVPPINLGTTNRDWDVERAHGAQNMSRAPFIASEQRWWAKLDDVG